MKRDSYLNHAFDAAFDRTAAEGFEEAGSGAEVRLPMLLRVVESRFRASDIPGLAVSSSIGSIVAGTGTFDSLQHLESDPSVLSVEASRPGALEETAQSLPFT